MKINFKKIGLLGLSIFLSSVLAAQAPIMAISTDQIPGYRDIDFSVGNRSEFYDPSSCSQSGSGSGSSSSADSSSSSGGGSTTGDTSSVSSFLDAYGEAAVKTGKKYRIPYTAILAQAALESGWGQSELTKKHYNFFGIKAGSGWTGDVVNMQTREVFGGQSQNINDNFRSYKSAEDGFNDYGQFIYKNERYKKAWNKGNDPAGYITELKNAGYATDPNYVSSNVNLQKKFEEEIARRNDPKYPDVHTMKYDENELDPIVKNGGQADGSGSGSSSTIGGEQSSTSGGVCCTKSSISISGNSNEEKIMSYLIGKGLTGAQAAGVMGNFKRESGFDPTIIQGGGKADENYVPVNGVGFGIAQWTFTARQKPLMEKAKQMNKPVTDLGVQLEFFWQEMQTTHKKALDSLKAANTPEDAAYVFHRDFEGSADSEAQVRANRGGDAKQIYEKYGNNASFSSGSSDSGSCDDSSSSSTGSGNLVYYNQNDPKWQSSGLPIALAGCGPTSISMIIATKKDKSVTPVEVAKYLQSTGDWSSGGIQWSGFARAGEKWGMKVTDLGNDWGKIKEALSSGKMLTVSGTGSSPFTSGGHIVVASGINGDKINIVNPAPGTQGGQEQKEFTIQQLQSAGFAHAWSFE